MNFEQTCGFRPVDSGWFSTPVILLFVIRQLMKAQSQKRNFDFAKKVQSRQPASPPGSYRVRWKVERPFTWVGNFRRMIVRRDRAFSMRPIFMARASHSFYGGF